jgi:hypothetical protein
MPNQATAKARIEPRSAITRRQKRYVVQIRDVVIQSGWMDVFENDDFDKADVDAAARLGKSFDVRIVDNAS